ncbi:MAG: hypothetical protein ACJARY_001654 [Candidatus Azotimanducaceae bacterium]|jgi:hypothetical protein
MSIKISSFNESFTLGSRENLRTDHPTDLAMHLIVVSPASAIECGEQVNIAEGPNISYRNDFGNTSELHIRSTIVF